MCHIKPQSQDEGVKPLIQVFFFGQVRFRREQKVFYLSTFILK